MYCADKLRKIANFHTPRKPHEIWGANWPGGLTDPSCPGEEEEESGPSGGLVGLSRTWGVRSLSFGPLTSPSACNPSVETPQLKVRHENRGDALRLFHILQAPTAKP